MAGGAGAGGSRLVAGGRDVIHQHLDPLPHFVYINEGTHVFTRTGWGPDNRIPASIDVVSIDGCE